MSKLLVSACLLGYQVRYDAKSASYDPRFISLMDAGLIVPVCPEVDGGLHIPRLPAEIDKGDGRDVLQQHAAVMRVDGVDVSVAFIKGARYALKLAKQHNIHIAILKSKSPSCSNTGIYDGTFSGTLKNGIGVTASLLSQHNIYVPLFF